MRNNMNTSVNKRIDKIKEGRGYEMASVHSSIIHTSPYCSVLK